MLAGTSALLALLSGGVAGAAVLSGDGGRTAEQTLAGDPGAAHLEQDPEIVSREAAAAEPLPQRHVHVPVQPAPPIAGQPAETGAELSRARGEDPADRTGPRVPRSSRTAADKPAAKKKPGSSHAKAEPVVTTRTDVETQPIPFRTRVVRDDSLPQGFRRVQTPGTPGEQTIRYLVTLVDGKPSGRRVLGTTVTRQPQQRVVVFGVQEDCASALDLCVPLGRRTTCPDEPAPATPAPRTTVTETEDGPPTVTDEDLALLDPDALTDLRWEPATVC
ncbi:G5 domain-containing protein [Actinoplanes sp. L3-i22]|uniref:G5 domain-containing protein n=1 Tax=Actinoplanes sp. L3-i22 TaxID=2836373 RepID=UPI001C748085|nr:G5 domain-containing protein [Actinoplanes sp. L3-i22]BCY14923.1 hypothetical protein L3i22_100110 [Actinoplanes sp. L3-i22]